MVKINYDAEIQEAQSSLSTASKELNTNIIITSQEDVNRAKIIITNLKGLLKSIEAKRISITGPLDTAKKNIQAIFSPMKDKINQAISRVESSIIEYARKKEEEIKEKEEEIKKNQPQDEVEELSQSLELASARSEQPAVKGKTIYYSAEVVDVNLIPKGYLIPDMQTINREAREKKENFNIPGCKLIKKEKIKG